MSCLEYLIAADRLVLAGLSAYDRAITNTWTTAAASMAKRGVPAAQIEAVKEEHTARTRRSRGRLHRELWLKALAMIAPDTLHVTSVRAEPLLKDDKFEVTEAEAKELEQRGLAKRAKAK